MLLCAAVCCCVLLCAALCSGYRDGPDVLEGVSFSVQPMEKIGVVGRTGSGKSTLLTLLFRIIEPRSGTVLIDGLDTATLGLRQLRKNLGIIPQTPVMFSGTLRKNLDPFGEHNDDRLWEVLSQVNLKETVEKLSTNSIPTATATESIKTTKTTKTTKTSDNRSGVVDEHGNGERLDFLVMEGGSNFSVGQRQLLCMGRALLLDPKILLLDEATAQIDQMTDALLQTMIRDKFAQKTVLTIAHRLETIMDSDRILVLDDGKIAQFDTPSALLLDTTKETGLFYALVHAEGIENAMRLESMVK